MTDGSSKPGADTVTLGRITGLYGVRGWIRVYSYTDPRQAVLEYREWWLERDGRRQRVEVAEGRRQGKAVIARVDGVEDRDAAATLIGSDVCIPRDRLPPPGNDRYYWSDLEGLKVSTRDGTELGTVAYLMETGAHDVLVVDGDAERLIPFVVGETIVDVNLDNGEITVDWKWD